MIPFNKPLLIGTEQEYIAECLTNNKLSGDGAFTKSVNKELEEMTGTAKALLTTSCTHALEMSSLLLDIEPGDEVIMSSFTFVSTANPFSLRGAKIIFVDIRPDTMNLDESKIESAITNKTKAIVPVHYAGVGCAMEVIQALAAPKGIAVIEDAAQCIGASYQGEKLGTIGDMGAFSFHDTKNLQCGEGGAILLNNPKYIERAEIIREKGTNRSKFLRGEIDKYSWVDKGSSYLPSELNAAFLLAQLKEVELVTQTRRALWQKYWDHLKPLADQGRIELPHVPDGCYHNGHIFYIKCSNIDERQDLITYLKSNQVYSVFHYIPLHSARAGKILGEFSGNDVYTTKESERLLRLPMFFELTNDEVEKVCQLIFAFYEGQ